MPQFVTGLTSGVTSICTGISHSCAVHNGAAKCWGAAFDGRLGNGVQAGSFLTPANVVGLSSGVVDITCGASFTCALLQNQTVMCWGAAGYLGRGAYTQASTPVPVVNLVNVDRIFSSRYATCAAVNSSSTTYCWGEQFYGQLGDGVTAGVANSPTKMAPLDFAGTGTVASFGGGFYFNCGVNSTEWANCVGYNSGGGLGDGTISNSAVPVPVIGLGNQVKQIANSWRTRVNCAVLTTGEAKCWGTFSGCCIGNGTSTAVTSLTPVSVIGPDDYKFIGVGDFHTCAVRGPNNEVWCWGIANNGRLGNNVTSGNFAAPQPVVYGEIL